MQRKRRLGNECRQCKIKISMNAAANTFTKYDMLMASTTYERCWTINVIKAQGSRSELTQDDVAQISAISACKTYDEAAHES